MKETKPKLRVGDWVKIAVPRFVERVGYPKTVDDYLPEVDKHKTELEALFVKLGLGHPVPWSTSIVFEQGPSYKTYEAIRRELAYALAKRDGFGGRKRSIHFVELPEYLDRTTQVEYLRTVQVGTYQPASGGRGWFDADDYDPPYLDVERYVRVARLNLWHIRNGTSRVIQLETPIEHLDLSTERSFQNAQAS